MTTKKKRQDIDYCKVGKDLMDKGKTREGFKYFKKGAKKDDFNCQFYLGYCHDFGFGTEGDDQKAIYWYKKAFKNNPSSETAKLLSLLYIELNDYVQALKWFIKAVENHKKGNK